MNIRDLMNETLEDLLGFSPEDKEASKKERAQHQLCYSGDLSPSQNYSSKNLLLILAKTGQIHATGFHRWKHFGRKVKKGAKSVKIFLPIFAKKQTNEILTEEADNTETPTVSPIGYKKIPVFTIDQTELVDEQGFNPQGVDKRQCVPINSLPMSRVAKRWGIDVSYQECLTHHAHWGATNLNDRIYLCDSQGSAFLHELMHVADARNGHMQHINDKSLEAQKERDKGEVIAEMGSCMIKKLLRIPQRATSLEYIILHAQKASPETTSNELVSIYSDRLKEALNLIIQDGGEQLELLT